MQRVRRFASVAIVAVLGVVVLAGCRSEPRVAAYVGDKRFTTAEVDEIVEEANRDARSPFRANRDTVVHLLVLDEIAGGLVGQQGVAVEDIPAEAVAQVTQIPETSRYVRLWTSVLGKQFALERAGTPVALTDDDLMEYYRAGVEGGAWASGAPMDRIREVLGREDIGKRFAVHRDLEEAFRRRDVVVNPRYGVPAQPMLVVDNSERAHELTLSFDAGDSAVRS